MRLQKCVALHLKAAAILILGWSEPPPFEDKEIIATCETAYQATQAKPFVELPVEK